MTYTDQIAAEVAARYGCAVDCTPQIIPRGVSGLPMPWEDKLSWRDQQQVQRTNQARAKRIASLKPEPVPQENLPRQKPPRPPRAARLIERDATIKRLAAEGKTAHAIALEVKISRERLYIVAKELGVKIIKHERLRGASPEVAERLARIKALAAEGLNRHQIADAMGMNTATVKNMLAKHRIKAAPCPPTYGPPLDVEQLKRMYGAGMSIHEIGRVLHRDSKRVSKALQAAGVKITKAPSLR